jgi:hypothetical protein
MVVSNYQNSTRRSDFTHAVTGLISENSNTGKKGKA